MSDAHHAAKLNGHAHPSHDKKASSSSSSSLPSMIVEQSKGLDGPIPGEASSSIVRQRSSSSASASASRSESTSSMPTAPTRTPNQIRFGFAAKPPGPRSETETRLLSWEREFKDRVRRTDWEVPRKALHGSVGFIVLYLHKHLPRSYSLQPLLRTLSTALVTICLADYVRLHYPSFAQVYNKYLGPLMRVEEREKVNGVVWYLIGVIFVLVLFPRDVAVVSILTLSWSDTTASTIGRLIGPYTPSLPSHFPLLPFLPFARQKSLAGFLAATVTGVTIGAYFWKDGSYGVAEWDFLRVGGGREGSLALGRGSVWAGKSVGLWLTAAVVGLGGATVEALDLGFDDNLTLPILSGAVVWAWLTVASYIL